MTMESPQLNERREFRNARRVLLVAEEPAILGSVSQLLVREGHEVNTAASGWRAIELFCRAIVADEAFDAVIVDDDMTVIDGNEVVDRLRTFGPGITTVLLVAPAEAPIEEQTRPALIRRVVKPVRIDELRAALSGECRLPQTRFDAR